MRHRARKSLAGGLSRAICDRCGRTVWLRQAGTTWVWAARSNAKPSPEICPATCESHVVLGRTLALFGEE